MGSRASNRARLVVDETAWTEAAGEAAVLAEFADETAVVQANVPAATEFEPYQRPHRGLRLLNPHTPMREVVRTILVGCLSAMALGASFAIGFGYVWSDRSGAPTSTSPAPVDGTAPSPNRGWLWPTLPERSSPPRATAAPAPQRTEGLGNSPSRAEPKGSAPRTSNRVPAQASKAPRATASSAISTETTAADPTAATPPVMADRADASSPALEEESILPSEPMLSAESGVVAVPVAPSPPVRPYPGPANAATEVGSGASAGQRVEVDAVRQAIERYETAYSQKDLGLMALVWPSLDIAGVARAFESVDRQALTLGECRVTTAGTLATAVCPGQVRYVGRVGNRQMQERQGTWTIALERRGDAWQFVRLNVR
jgi:hypothetical protein